MVVRESKCAVCLKRVAALGRSELSPLHWFCCGRAPPLQGAQDAPQRAAPAGRS